MKIKFDKAPGVYMLLLCLFFFYGCNHTKEKELSTPISGTVKIGFDETLRPLATEELNAFQAEYKNAHIMASFKPEIDLVNDFMKDSSEVIMLSRKLTAQENKLFESKQLQVITTKIAFDALALITNKDNPDSILKYEQVSQIFSGKASDWKELGPKNSGTIRVVFDNQNSSTLRYMMEHFNKGGKAPATWSALKTNEEVIDYVSKNKEAIGVIGVNWISNHNDHAANSFLKKIQVVAISPPDTSKGAGEAYQPYQAYIALRYYPLYRDIYMISREGRSGLGAGFMSFVATDRGQSIINLAGLLPANAPIRIMQVKKKLEEQL